MSSRNLPRRPHRRLLSVAAFLIAASPLLAAVPANQPAPLLPLDRWSYHCIDRDRARYGDFPAEGIKPWVRYYGLAMGDLSNDGRPDIISGRYFYRNSGGDLTARWDRVDLGLNVDACLIVDVDGDRRGDVIAMSLPDLYWLEAKDDAATQWEARKIGTAPRTGHNNSQGFTTAQIVPGGRPEIAIATEDGVYYFEIPAQSETTPWPRTLITKEASDEGIDFADIDGDGLVDLVAGQNEKHLSWWKNPGPGGGEWKRHRVGSTAPRPVDRVRVRDLNGDGRPDIVVTEERYPGKEPDSTLWWFENPGNPVVATADWTRHAIITTWSLNSLDAADFDGDGDIDLITCEHKGPDLRLLLFENDGRGRFKEHVLDRGKESHLGTIAADLDGDGDLDIVSIGWDRHEYLHLWRNDAIRRAPATLPEGAAVFREVNYHPGAKPGTHISELELDATFKFVGEHAWGATKARRVEQKVALDLQQARSAELCMEYWGGHIGTHAQQVQINGHGWRAIVQPCGTPAAPERFFRTLHGNNALPIPLSDLRSGQNVIQFGAGHQIDYGFGFGYFWIYDFMVRVYYDDSRPHPTGEIIAPKTGDTFGDTLVLEASASSPNGAITRVEFIGEYDDFDWDGDGIWREWQYTTHYGVMRNHLGTAMAPPWRVTWDARWVPDQRQPSRVRARITDASGMIYLTPPVASLMLKRTDRSVVMVKARDIPEDFGVRAKRTKKCHLDLPADLSRVKSARLVMSTWSAGTDLDCVHELRWNGERLANRFGQFHDHSFDTIEVPLAKLKPGANEFATYSEFMGHGLEINWPGPVLLLEYAK